MSIVANNKLIGELEGCLKDVVLYSDMETLIHNFESILAKYEIIPIVEENTGRDALLDAFINAMRVEGLSRATLGRYRYVIEKMLEFSKAVSSEITQYHIRQYLAAMKEKGTSDATIRSYCWVYSAYFGWLHRDGIIQKKSDE